MMDYFDKLQIIPSDHFRIR